MAKKLTAEEKAWEEMCTQLPNDQFCVVRDYGPIKCGLAELATPRMICSIEFADCELLNSDAPDAPLAVAVKGKNVLFIDKTGDVVNKFLYWDFEIIDSRLILLKKKIKMRTFSHIA